MKIKTTEQAGVVIHRRESRGWPVDVCRAGQMRWRKHAARLRLLARAPGNHYVFCRPQGGWNDTLVQVSRCLEYAVRHGRRLMVDTARSGLLDELTHYFRPALAFPGIEFSVPAGFAEASRGMSCIPSCLAGRGIVYGSSYDEQANYVETTSRQPLTFDMQRSHAEQLLVHEQCGGGGDSRKFFDWAEPVPRVCLEIRKRLASLPGRYVALHVRHTDRSTRYPEFFEAAKPHVAGTAVLVCTDSLEVLTYARKAMDSSKVFSVSDIPDSRGQSLHHNPGVTDWNVNVGGLVDLAAMSRAQAILHPSPSLGFASGFVALAVSLMRSRAFPV